MLVRLVRNYDAPDLLRQTPGGTGRWEDLSFTLEDSKVCDYVVVLNHPPENLDVVCREGGCWLIVQEPPDPANRYLERYFPYFDRVYSQFRKPGDRRHRFSHTALPWQIDLGFDELLDLSPDDMGPKRNEVCWITSAKSHYLGHRRRLTFLHQLQRSRFPFELYGRGFREIADKSTILRPRKYTLAVENHVDEAYWTEKIADALLCWTLPFYSGCTNLERFLPERSFVRIDLDDVDGAIRSMQTALEEDWWSARLDAIAEARQHILNEHRLFPFLTQAIHEHAQGDAACRRRYRVPADPRSRLQRLAVRIAGSGTLDVLRLGSRRRGR